MTSNATGSGMGTAGLVGQIMTWQTMIATEAPMVVLIKILVIPDRTAVNCNSGNLRIHAQERMDQVWLKYGDMKLDL